MSMYTLLRNNPQPSMKDMETYFQVFKNLLFDFAHGKAFRSNKRKQLFLKPLTFSAFMYISWPFDNKIKKNYKAALSHGQTLFTICC
jgi:hypothetical protein